MRRKRRSARMRKRKVVAEGGRKRVSLHKDANYSEIQITVVIRKRQGRVPLFQCKVNKHNRKSSKR